MTVTDTPPTAALAVTIDAAALKAAMAKLKPALAKTRNGYGKALECVQVHTDGADVMLAATDLDVSVSTLVTGNASAAGTLLVPAAVLNKVISVRPKGTVEISGCETGGQVRNGNASLAFGYTPVEDLPIAQSCTGRTVELRADVFAELLPAVLKDGSRPILCAVFVDDGCYVATDSYRLHLVDTHASTGDGFLVSAQSAAVIAQYPGTMRATVSDDWITVVLDATTTMTARLVPGEFPRYQSLIPVGQAESVTFTDDIHADLKTLAKLNIADPSNPLKVSQSETGRLELRIGHDDTAAIVTTPGTTTIDLVAYNPKYLAELLAGTTSNRLGLTDRLKPAVLREPAPEYGDTVERLRLIMPVRVT